MGKEVGKSQEKGVEKNKTDVNSSFVFKSSCLNRHAKVKAFNDLHCFYTNADSLPNKFGELKTRVQERDKSYDIIGITEVNPKNCRYLPGKAELEIEGYELFINNANSKRQGISMYIKKTLKLRRLR